MVEYPKSVLNAAKKADRQHPDNIEKAVDVAEVAIRKLPVFKKLMSTLIRVAIREMIYDTRHTKNRQIKRDNGSYDTHPRVSVGKSPAVRRAHESLYNLPIAGTILGQVMGCDLEQIANSEKAIGEGHMVNSRLAKYLQRVVPDDQCVREAVPEAKLIAIYQRAEKGGK